MSHAGTHVQPLYTIGHSTHPLDEFLELLRAHGVERLVDVRRFPGSRRHPHFGSDSLRITLPEAGIDYRHAVDLGGRRRAAPDSPNTWWKNDSFRAYADHMATPEFRRELDRLLNEAATASTAVMCAEAVPWRCHRNLLSDAVVARGVPVEHILGRDKRQPHTLHGAARSTAEGTLVYAAGDAVQGRLAL